MSGDRRRGGDHGDRGRGGDRGSDRVVYGAGPVTELVNRKASTVKSIWVDPKRAGRSTSDPIAAIVVAARNAGVQVEDRDRASLDRVAGEGGNHQGVVAFVGEFKYAELETLIAEAPALIVALDGVEDPRNLGAILRSAYLLGAAARVA
jgi:23S rRNA (guanosine2251-2'-O)-methyltransferase